MFCRSGAEVETVAPQLVNVINHATEAGNGTVTQKHNVDTIISGIQL
jgi:hypothetical protein